MIDKKLDLECLYSINNYHGCAICFWYGLDFDCTENCPERRTLKDIEAENKNIESENL